MQRKCLAAIFTVLVLTSSSANSATTRTKVGKLRLFVQNPSFASIVKFGRADGGTFDGCTLDPGYVSTIRPASGAVPLVPADALAMLLSAKQNNFDVLVGYVVEPSGRCVLRTLELQ